MNLDNRIKDALRAEAGQAEATPAKWDAIRASTGALRRGRRSERFIVAGLSVAAVIAIVVGIVVVVGEDQTRGPITSQPTEAPSEITGPNGAPPYVVVVTEEGKLQIRESASGRVVRTLDATFDPRYAAPTLVASPDGRYLWTDRVFDEPCADGVREIVRIDLLLGGSSVIAQGERFALSPNGRRIAYVTSRDCGDAHHLVARTLEGTGEQRWALSGGTGTVGAPRWSPDNRMLAVEIFVGRGSSATKPSLRLVDTTSGEGLSALEDALEIPLPESTRSFGFLRPDELLGLATPEDGTQVIGFNTAGEQTRALGVIPGVADARSAAGSPDGQHVLVLRETPGGASGTAEPPMRTLSIVSDGVDQPHFVADDVLAATWLTFLPGERGPAASGGSQTQDGRPDTIVAASADGSIVELDSANGRVIRTLAPRAPQPSGRNEEIALSPDGKYVYFEHAVEDLSRGCEASAFEAGEIMRVRRAGGPVEPVVTGRWPAISPDGRSLAFISYERCDGPGRLGVIAADSGEDAQLWQGPKGISIEGPLSWDAEGESVLVRAKRGDDWASSYIDITSSERVVSGLADQDFSDREPLVRTWTMTNGRVYYSLNDGNYASFASDGTDLILGSGSVEFNGGRLLSFTTDASGQDCLYIVERPNGTQTLWTRGCTGDSKPTQFGGFYTAAAW